MKLFLITVVLSVAAAGQSVWAAASDEYKITPDVVYGHKAGMALTFDVIQPKKPNGAGVMFMVSGGWVSFWIPPETIVSPHAPELLKHFKDLVDRGYTLFIVRHGSSPQFKVPEAVDDVRRAARYIRLHAADFGVDPERIGVCGGSAGDICRWCWERPATTAIRTPKIKSTRQAIASRQSWPTSRRWIYGNGWEK